MVQGQDRIFIFCALKTLHTGRDGEIASTR